jgi:hypothetical protein
MTLYGFHAMCPSVSPVPIHLEGHMLRHWSLFECANEQFPDLLDCPFSGRRLNEQSAESRYNVGHLVRPRLWVSGSIGRWWCEKC